MELQGWSGRVVPALDQEETARRLEAAPASPPMSRGQEREAERETDPAPRRKYISLTDDPEAFTEDERDILLAIRDKEHTADEISDSAQIPARRVLSALTLLQVKDYVAETPEKRFRAKVRLKME